MQIKSKEQAQQRVDQIESFRSELEILQNENILTLDEHQRSNIKDYHKKLFAHLTSAFDIDASKREKQLSQGMKITSFLGAMGLGASIFFLFYQFWGRFSTETQVFILISAILISLLATMLVSQKEKTGYFSKLLGLVCIVCFVLNLSMLGQIFNLESTPNAFLLWALLALLLAYASDARLVLAIGIIFLAAFLSAKTGTWNGCYWISFGERPENFFPAALVLFCIPIFPHHRFSGFSAIYRVFALLLFFIPVLILSNWGAISYLNFSNSGIETFYQIIGFVFSALAIWLGIKMGWPEVINTGNVFFTIFLYTKFFDWWWDSMPKYLFFLIIGLAAILILIVFKRLRNSYIKNAQEVSI